MNDYIHSDGDPSPHYMEHECSEKSENIVVSYSSEMVSSEVISKVRDHMEMALGHDNFEVNEKDYKDLGRRKIVDADISIFFTNRTLNKRFIFYDESIIGVKDRNT